MPWNFRSGMAAVAVALSMVGRTEAMPADEFDLATIRSELKQSWESLHDIQFQSDGFGTDKQGRRTTPYHIRTNFAHSRGGRWAYQSKAMLGDVVKQFVSDIRQNGKTQWSVATFPNHPEVTNMVFVRSQSDDDRTYSEGMTALLWLWIPGGKPPIAHLDAGGQLEATRVDGKLHALIRATHKDVPIVIELDPDHDWLPFRVTAEDFLLYEATQFRRDNGRWFYERGFEIRHHGPVSGYDAGEIVAQPEGDTRREFLVKTLTINRPLNSTLFNAPPTEPGVLIQDSTTGRDKVIGGHAAFAVRQRRYGTKPSSEPVAQPIGAAIDPPSGPWGASLLVASAAALLTAGFLMVRSSRSKR